MNIDRLIDVLPSTILDELRLILSIRTITKFQLCHLLSQCHHESNGWKVFEENLNYSANTLLRLFPKKCDNSLDKAKEIVKKGVVFIGNTIYDNRMGNLKGEGYKFRGRGVIQLTGKNNYKLFSASVHEDLVENPDLVKEKYKLTSAFWFFDINKLWLLCNGDKVEDVKKVTLSVNGGLNGFNERVELFKRYCKILK